MAKQLPALLLVCTWLVAGTKKPVTIPDVVSPPRAPAAENIVWSADGQRFAFLLEQRLWVYEVASRARRELLSLSELRSAAAPVPEPKAFQWENRRVREERLQWLPGGQALMLKVNGDLFLVSASDGKWTQLTKTPVDEKDPKLSPDGKRVSFRRESDLYVLEIGSGRLARLTRDGSETIWNAKLDWVYPEELDLGTAHWWSPDSRWIAYLQFDVSRQPLYPHTDLLPLRPVFEPQRYPKAGEPNATVRLGVVPSRRGRTRWLMEVDGDEALLARVCWHPSARALWVQRLNRIQNRLELIEIDVESRRSRLVLREEDPHWVNVADILAFLRQGEEFVWSSERSGFRHLYLYRRDGTLLRQLTSGDWEVTDLCGVDEAAGVAYFVATEASPLERHMYSVSLEGGPPKRLTRDRGTYTVNMPPGARYYLLTHSSLTSPPSRTLHTADGRLWAVFEAADLRIPDQFELLAVELVQVRAPQGHLLDAALIRPAGFQAGRKYPAVVFVYGGPHAQQVRNRWEGLTLEQALAHRGFVIWKLDNRGSSGRGHQWESALYRRFGLRELEDQKAGLEYLLSLGFVDPERVGIYGWSYGGYLTLYAMLNAPNLFKAGVAGAPVTDWRSYDTIYTERYLGLPGENPDGYRLSSVVHQAALLTGRLMLVHNLEDDNVLFQHTLQMADALQRAGKLFELMIYPQKSHGVTGPARVHLLNTIVDFFERHLKPSPVAAR